VDLFGISREAENVPTLPERKQLATVRAAEHPKKKAAKKKRSVGAPV